MGKKLLITGASGLLGYALCRQAKKSWDVYGICCRGRIGVDNVQPLRIDLTDPTQLRGVFRAIRPDGVIHAAALSLPNSCEQEPELSERVNVRASEEIARCCKTYGTPLVFTSTDLVFNGLQPPYDESSQVSPVCVYGKHKAAAEKSIHRIYRDAVICRMPLMLGHAPETGSGFLGFMVKSLREGSAINLFGDEFRTPVDTMSAASGLLQCLELRGELLHMGGRKRMNRLEMGRLVADILGADRKLLNPVSMADLTMSAARSPDVSLISDRGYALGYAPHDLARSLEVIISEMCS